MIINSVDLDVVVSEDGGVIVSPEVVRSLALVPGQRVRVRVAGTRLRTNMYGVLAGKVVEVTAADIAAERRSVWGELADGE